MEHQAPNIRPVLPVWLVHGQLDSAGLGTLTLSHSDRLPAWQSRLLKGCSQPARATVTSCRDVGKKKEKRAATLQGQFHIFIICERWQRYWLGLFRSGIRLFLFFFFIKGTACTANISIYLVCLCIVFGGGEKNTSGLMLYDS